MCVCESVGVWGVWLDFCRLENEPQAPKAQKPIDHVPSGAALLQVLFIFIVLLSGEALSGGLWAGMVRGKREGWRIYCHGVLSRPKLFICSYPGVYGST